jgi:para-aminobenzoate synthetase component 1
LRTTQVFTISDADSLKISLLHWAQQFEEVVWLDSNADDNILNRNYKSYDAILAVEALTAIRTDAQNAFEDLREYQTHTSDWIFGYLTYDLKNDLENLNSNNYDGLGFPELYFFQPKKLFFLNGTQLEISYLNLVADEMEEDFQAIKDFKLEKQARVPKVPEIKARIPKEDYLKKVSSMLHHIQMGDIYEANFCQEFFAENADIHPLETYLKLNAISTPPFAVFLKLTDLFLLSASPERFIRKEGNKIISQPIKGTARRAADLEEDYKLSRALENDPKERSENIMITDLVRNDLSRTATRNSVQVEELCKRYTFKQVHQLITTVISEVSSKTSIIDVLITTFPMGSMTGAPKESALKIIESLEETKRGLYSGAVGYITPTGNADFNVVIRSILYNSSNNYLSFSVGSAITIKSQPENEFEECLLKAKAMLEVLK